MAWQPRQLSTEQKQERRLEAARLLRRGVPQVRVADDAYSGEAGHPFRTKPITDSGKPITDSGQADQLRDDAGGVYFAAFLVVVKLSALRMDSPPSLRRWALWTSLSQMASARVASPMTACQSLGSSWLVRTVELSW